MDDLSVFSQLTALKNTPASWIPGGCLSDADTATLFGANPAVGTGN